MTASTNSLAGLKRVDIVTSTPGDAPIRGSFKLSFRGSVTEAISIASSASDTATNIQTALNNLDTISSVTVLSNPILSTSTNGYSATGSLQFSVTFSSTDLQGDVEAIQVVNAFNLLTGTNVNLAIFTDGQDAVRQ